MFEETPFTAFLSRMSRESQHTRFEDQILGQISLWGRPACLPACVQEWNSVHTFNTLHPQILHNSLIFGWQIFALLVLAMAHYRTHNWNWKLLVYMQVVFSFSCIYPPLTLCLTSVNIIVQSSGDRIHIHIHIHWPYPCTFLPKITSRPKYDVQGFLKQSQWKQIFV